MTRFYLFLLLLGAPSLLWSYSEDSTAVNSLDEEALMEAYTAWMDSVSASLTYTVDSSVVIGDGLARLHVPEGFKYLDPESSEMVLTDLWGNPPSSPGYESLGMLFPAASSPADTESFAINITFSEEGYIDDSDAKEIDYDELLEEMQSDLELGNEERMAQGYDPIYLTDWAADPYYDASEKKLHWAMDLQFGEAEDHTLNYNIRVLGRRGYLSLNVIADMNALEEVKQNIDPILTSIQFEDGHRYGDFDSNIDKVAAYGIGGLIAGKVLVKAGLFAKVGLLLAKFWKVIALGAVGLFAGVRRFFSKQEEGNA